MRASRAPEKWQLVLRDDYELANKLAVKYNFASKVKEETVYDDARHKSLAGKFSKEEIKQMNPNLVALAVEVAE